MAVVATEAAVVANGAIGSQNIDNKTTRVARKILSPGFFFALINVVTFPRTIPIGRVGMLPTAEGGTPSLPRNVSRTSS